MYVFLFILAIIVAIGAFIVGIYNRLVGSNIKVDAAWSDIDVQLKRRYDLIGNLVETVKGYASHEKSVFEEVTKARSVAMGAGNPAERAEAESGLTSTLKTLFAVAENYPELKANQNFLSLQDDLEETENKIESSRRYYNGVVRDIPIRYKTEEGIYKLDFRVLSVVNETGSKYRYDTSTKGDFISIKIGDPDIYVTGKNIYIITYEMSGALNYFDEHDELYWNVTGNNWLVNINNASCKVTLPQKVKSGDIKLTCYTGKVKSQEKNCESE
ncbi:unnamed protein product, partial [marine sediment metagenome]